MRIVREKEGEAAGTMVYVNREEAMRIIKSLAQQMSVWSANTGREEFYTEDEEYFTIAVKEKQ